MKLPRACRSVFSCFLPSLIMTRVGWALPACGVSSVSCRQLRFSSSHALPQQSCGGYYGPAGILDGRQPLAAPHTLGVGSISSVRVATRTWPLLSTYPVSPDQCADFRKAQGHLQGVSDDTSECRDKSLVASLNFSYSLPETLRQQQTCPAKEQIKTTLGISSSYCDITLSSCLA